MSESNKALVHRWMEECFRQRNAAITDELFAQDHVCHEASARDLKGRDVVKQMFLIDWFAAFPDMECRIEAQAAEGDRVLMYWRWSGTQTAEFLGVPATGRKVEVESVLVSRIHEGRIVETWEVWAAFGCYRQLALRPLKGVRLLMEHRTGVLAPELPLDEEAGAIDALAPCFGLGF